MIVRKLIGKDRSGATVGEVVFSADMPSYSGPMHWDCHWAATGLIEKSFRSTGTDPMQALTAMIFDMNVIAERLVPDGVTLFWEDGRPYREGRVCPNPECPLSQASTSG